MEGVAYGLRGIPRLNVTKVLLRSRRELELELKSKQPIDMLHEVKDSSNLFFDLQCAKLREQTGMFRKSGKMVT